MNCGVLVLEKYDNYYGVDLGALGRLPWRKKILKL